MLTALRLPFRFDPAGLGDDLRRVPEEAWTPHYNDRDFGGIWRGAALRSASGHVTDLAAMGARFVDTPLLGKLAHVRAAVAAFQCPLKGVRLLALAPGSFIREHSDNALDFEDGEARIHIPVQTNPEVEFYVRGERIVMAPGGTYYVNVNLPHRVSNRGATERVHLVIDAEVNDWLREVFGRSEPMAAGPAPEGGIDAFREWLWASAGARDRLRAIPERVEFVAEAVRLRREAGFEFHEGDVEAVLDGEARPGPPGGLAYRLEDRNGVPWMCWTDAPPQGLAEPFFADTVRAALRTPWGKFSRRAAPLEGSAARPRGFIFHMSRCGSTLVSQLLKAAGYRVAAEAPAVDAALSLNPRWLSAVVAALDVDFVKFDSWHAHRLPEIRAAFPDTPWIFLRRETEDVVASQMRNPGLHALPGALRPETLQMTMADVARLGREEWTRRVIGKIEASAERYRDAKGLWLDYRELPDAAWGAVARHFGLDLRAEQIERMREAARFDAKSPSRVFAGEPGAR